MRTPLAQGVLENIRRSAMLVPGDRVGVAVSGGADSLALLRLLEELRSELGITLLVIHLDHSLRGAESKADAQFVEDVARTSGLEFILGCEDVATEAVRRRWNLEDAGRRLRYAFFERLVREGRATRIAVAHTADDQAETVLAHLIRGTGPTGLAGIYPIINSIVRPLLGVRREETREYLRSSGQTWREDSSNRDVQRMRARIREQLIPILERDFSPAIVPHLNELSRFAREEEMFWDALAENRFRTHARKTGEDLTIRIQDLLSPLGLRATPGEKHIAWRTLTERLIRRLYEGLRGDHRELGARHVAQVIRLASESTSGRRVELPNGIVVERSFDDLIFSPGGAVKGPRAEGETIASWHAYHYVVDLPDRGAATICVPELGKRFHLKVIDWPLAESDTKRDGEALDADLLRTPLILRNWRPGDAYRPRGRRQARKLKQMFLAGRVPSRERSGWPVLESGGKVIWTRGMPPADEFCAREGTRSGVVIEEDRL
jgi:tRNA(Ile)-lysidine synthase